MTAQRHTHRYVLAGSDWLRPVVSVISSKKWRKLKWKTLFLFMTKIYLNKTPRARKVAWGGRSNKTWTLKSVPSSTQRPKVLIPDSKTSGKYLMPTSHLITHTGSRCCRPPSRERWVHSALRSRLCERLPSPPRSARGRVHRRSFALIRSAVSPLFMLAAILVQDCVHNLRYKQPLVWSEVDLIQLERWQNQMNLLKMHTSVLFYVWLCVRRGSGADIDRRQPFQRGHSENGETWHSLFWCNFSTSLGSVVAGTHLKTRYCETTARCQSQSRQEVAASCLEFLDNAWLTLNHSLTVWRSSYCFLQ